MRTFILAAALSLSAASTAFAQSGHGSMHAGAGMDLPEACRPTTAAMGQGESMPNMQGMMERMGPAQKEMMRGMMKNQQPMMMGMMVQDTDVAFVCGMIPHHQAAIDMARVEVKSGKDPEIKKMAEKIIKDQEAEIAQMKEWLTARAKR